MRNTQCARPTMSPVWWLPYTFGLIICKIHRVIIWSNKHCTAHSRHNAQSAALLKWAAYGWPMKYTKHTKLHKTHNITGYTSPGRYMVGHTWLPIQPLWNLSCSVPPTPISPWRYKYKYKHTHEIREVKSQKKCFTMFLVACISPEFFSPTKLISTTHGEILSI